MSSTMVSAMKTATQDSKAPRGRISQANRMPTPSRTWTARLMVLTSTSMKWRHLKAGTSAASLPR